MIAVQIEVGSLAHTLKFYEELSVGKAVNLEMLPIPADGVSQVDNITGEGLRAIESVGQRNRFPTGVVEISGTGSLLVANLQQPSVVEQLSRAVLPI